MPNKWVVVLIRKGQRKEQVVENAKVGQALVYRATERGFKAHLISRHRAFPPKGDDPADGRWWCPYCRRYRWFEVPRGDEDAPMLTEDGELNLPAYYAMCNRLEMRICLWCGVGASEFWVRFYNPEAMDHSATRRRKSKRVRRRR